MIRMILDKVDDNYVLDVLDTTQGGKLDVTRFDNLTAAAIRAHEVVSNWTNDRLAKEA